MFIIYIGTSVAVYGTINPSGSRPRSTYVIDGGSAFTYTAPDTSDFAYSVLFYQSPTLSDDQHTLVITDTHSFSAFLIDYMLYT